LVAVDMDARSVREVIPKMTPLARDFVVDGKSRSLFFTNKDELSSAQWNLERVGLATQERQRLASSATAGFAPYVLPNGRLLINSEGQKGLEFFGAQGPFRSPMGVGVDVVRAHSQGGTWISALHSRPGKIDIPFALNIETGKTERLAGPEGFWVEVAGFWPDGAVP
jgi:hypothetical protein